MRNGFTKPKPGVDKDIFNAGIVQSFHGKGKLIEDFQRDVFVVGILLHGLRIAFHVHQHIGNA